MTSRTVLLLLIGCGGDDAELAGPALDVTPFATSVGPNETLTLDGTASSGAGSVDIVWRASHGTLSSAVGTVTWTAPFDETAVEIVAYHPDRYDLRQTFMVQVTAGAAIVDHGLAGATGLSPPRGFSFSVNSGAIVHDDRVVIVDTAGYTPIRAVEGVAAAFVAFDPMFNERDLFLLVPGKGVVHLTAPSYAVDASCESVRTRAQACRFGAYGASALLAVEPRPEGFVAVAEGSRVDVWTRSGHLAARLDAGAPITGLVFGPGGASIYAGTAQGARELAVPLRVPRSPQVGTRALTHAWYGDLVFGIDEAGALVGVNTGVTSVALPTPSVHAADVSDRFVAVAGTLFSGALVPGPTDGTFAVVGSEAGVLAYINPFGAREEWRVALGEPVLAVGASYGHALVSTASGQRVFALTTGVEVTP